MDKLLNLLGLAAKASYLTKGTDTVIEELKHKKLQIVFAGSDCSEKTIDKLMRKCYFYAVPLCLYYTSDELSKAVGASIKVIAIKNKQFYGAMKEYLEGKIYEG